MPRAHVRSHDHMLHNITLCNLAEARELQQLYQDTMKSTSVPLRT